MANLTKHCLIDLTQGIQGIVWEECDVCENVVVEARSLLWMGKRDKPCEYHQLVNRDCWPTHELLRHVFSRKARTLFISLTKPMASSLHPLTFPLVSVQFRHTLRVCREVSLTVSDDQRELGECVIYLCVARLLHSSSFGAQAQTIASLVPIAFGVEH